MDMTKNEKMVIESIESYMDEEGFSDAMVEDIVSDTKLSVESVKGVLGSLIKKNLVTYQDVNGLYNVYYSVEKLNNI